MHIKEITIDGFKSYSVKTNLSYFDSQFNSITGLNGSGKSNILDAICFVLGISSLSHVRASNLNELIYKYGQAGINKAIVSIHFDNTDKSTSPINYIDYEEIIVTRIVHQSKSKYLLNGYNVTHENIKSFFYSVNININNPHFLIMQGKVTQVVNMKPLEILGLLEEAAGTSMYENNKEKAIKAMKKKENKLEEINKTIKEEISPHLEKLQRDKQNYLTWKSREDEIANLQKLISAKNYQIKREGISDKNSDLLIIKENITNLKNDFELKIKILEEINSELNKFEKHLSKEDDEELKQLSNTNKKLAIEIKNLKLKEELLNKNSQKAISEISSMDKEFENKNSILENLKKVKNERENSLSLIEKEIEMKQELLIEYQRNLENINKGIKGNEIHNINNLIGEVKRNTIRCNAEKKNLLNQLKIFEDDFKILKNKEKDFLRTSEEMRIKSKEIDQHIDSLKREMNHLELEEKNEESDYYNVSKNPGEIIEQMKKEIFTDEQQLQIIQEKQNELMTRYAARVEVFFRDPEQNFDRRKVKGRIIRLFTLENEIYSTALEQLAGGRLYNIVTDNEKTSGLLLNRRCFDGNNTFIPLNKINFKEIPDNIKKLIWDMVGDDAILAIDLIKFDRELTPAMKFVFGTTYVCKNSDVAKKLTYTDKIKVRCVNLNGDIFDPSGSMTGGSTNKSSENIILKVKELTNIQKKIKETKYLIQTKKECIQKNVENIGRCSNLKTKLEYLNQEKLSLSEENILKQKKMIELNIRNKSEEIKTILERIDILSSNEKKYETELAKLNTEQSELKINGSSKDVFSRKIKENKHNIEEISKIFSNMKKEFNDILFNLEKNEKEIIDLTDNLNSEKLFIETTNKELNDIKTKIKENEMKSEKISMNYKNKLKEKAKNEKEYNSIKNEKDKKEFEVSKMKTEISNMETKVVKLEKELKESSDLIKKLEKENPWILTDYEYFGEKDSEYDFTGFDLSVQSDNLEKLKEENEKLKRKVNMKVDTMTDKSEKLYEDLFNRKEILMKDKDKIEKAIFELDEKRKDAMTKIYEHTNKYLNSIYSSLLPGTKAKLDILPGKDLMDGLELKVAFNNSWKASLSELSGGQRSLLALSLILSLLRFKPAPFYILDEIDAALDLSHTANLGVMIKEQFPQSQFIVVSLKDGMFTNANVLYKVTFVDGSSRVERIAKEKKINKNINF